MTTRTTIELQNKRVGDGIPLPSSSHTKSCLSRAATAPRLRHACHAHPIPRQNIIQHTRNHGMLPRYLQAIDADFFDSLLRHDPARVEQYNESVCAVHLLQCYRTHEARWLWPVHVTVILFEGGVWCQPVERLGGTGATRPMSVKRLSREGIHKHHMKILRQDVPKIIMLWPRARLFSVTPVAGLLTQGDQLTGVATGIKYHHNLVIFTGDMK